MCVFGFAPYGRKEHRGVGGVFFDDLERIGEEEAGKEKVK